MEWGKGKLKKMSHPNTPEASLKPNPILRSHAEKSQKQLAEEVSHPPSSAPFCPKTNINIPKIGINHSFWPSFQRLIKHLMNIWSTENVAISNFLVLALGLFRYEILYCSDVSGHTVPEPQIIQNFQELMILT